MRDYRGKGEHHFHVKPNSSTFVRNRAPEEASTIHLSSREYQKAVDYGALEWLEERKPSADFVYD